MRLTSVYTHRAMPCPDCNGTGVYVGLFTREPCRTCSSPPSVVPAWSIQITIDNESWPGFYEPEFVEPGSSLATATARHGDYSRAEALAVEQIREEIERSFANFRAEGWLVE